MARRLASPGSGVDGCWLVRGSDGVRAALKLRACADRLTLGPESERKARWRQSIGKSPRQYLFVLVWWSAVGEKLDRVFMHDGREE
jgi:hypothetical protein